MRTKIICTIGPASESEAVIRAMIRAGMDVARLNFSHGSRADHERRIATVRRIAAEESATVAVMGDLQGPKFRIGRLTDEGIELTRDQEIVLSDHPDGRAIPLPHPDLLAAMQIGQKVLIDDGAMSLVVVRRLNDTRVGCRVVNGGRLTSNKGVSVPGLKIATSPLTPKDRDDVQFALAQGVDALALSFVRSVHDVRELRQLIATYGGDPLIVAKIEKPEAMDDLIHIVQESDAVMVARGDLGVEAAPEEVPFLQKHIILTCLRVGKPVITATQMLQSMITSPQPTRAEASDVANAVLDGADAVMLSGETSVGAYPVETVQTMARIIESTETHGLELIHPLGSRPRTRGGAITRAAVEVANQLEIPFLATFTESGDSARRLSRLRPRQPIYAFTHHEHTHNILCLTWGVYPKMVPFQDSTDKMTLQVEQSLTSEGIAQHGDLVVIAAGSPPGAVGSTNTLRVHRVGDDAAGGSSAASPQTREPLGFWPARSPL